MKYTWEQIHKRITEKNKQAFNTLKSLNIQPIASGNRDRNIMAIRDIHDTFLAEVSKKEFPYHLANNMYNGGGSISSISGDLRYVTENLEIRTRFGFPWKENNSLLLKCQPKVRRMISRYIEWFYKGHILTEDTLHNRHCSNKEKKLTRHFITFTLNPLIKLMKKEKIKKDDERNFEKLIISWEDFIMNVK